MAWTNYIKTTSDTIEFFIDTQGDVMVAIDQSIYVIGYEKTERELQVQIFHAETSQWEKVRLMHGNNSQHNTPREMERYFAVVHDGNILVYAQNFPLDCSLFVFNTHTLRWNRLSPDGDISWNQRWWGGCALHGNLYILKKNIKFELWALDLGIMRWSFVSEIELENSFFPVRFLAYENCIYILIEVLRDGRISIVYYDTVNKTWGSLDAPGNVQFSHPAWRSFFYSKHLYYISGIPDQPEIVSRYSLEREEWTNIRFEGVSSTHEYSIGSVVVLDSKAFFLEFWNPDVLHVLDFEPTLKTRCLSAVFKYGLDTSGLPESLQRELSKYKRSA